MISRHVFEIPIYRVSPGQFRKELDRLRAARTDPANVYKNRNMPFWKSHTKEQQLQTIESWKRNFDRSPEARGWRYNDVVGFIVVRASTGQLKADLWFIEGQRIRRERTYRHLFQYIGKVLEQWITSKDTSATIYKKLNSRLVRLRADKPIKGRYLDLECFHNIGPLVDWKSLTS